MGQTESGAGHDLDLDLRLAARLAELRTQRAWSLEDLARRSGVSRSTLSRLERAEISPTTALLSKLCATYELTMSRLLAEVEPAPSPLVPADRQPVWHDDDAGITRRSVSPPSAGLRGEVVEVTLRAGADIAYEGSPVPGLEHHAWILAGAVEVTVDGSVHEARAGDCLRFRLWGSSRWRSLGPDPARYALALVLP
ncbi:helix-turn-helix domain-containing protein [Saccharothrix variisporea]|uniref:XRE family transcriptional regulator n=1 Tax=Saccharothrix variisporea TaxID=543527 RepID=A0A495XNJ1_9PSEU|nr:XRE family transcriptional regulator [Saccharothrix variisporea]RKT73218.1 XRE family transcriptional regulator [Saccharothrix variisporea]